MTLRLGVYVFDPEHTAVHEEQEEVAGRDERRVTLTGLIVGEGSAGGVEARLDAILEAASNERGPVELSLREGRVLYVRRQSFKREVVRQGPAGSFTLALMADDPYEVAEDPTETAWSISEQGASLLLLPVGSVESLPVITVVALDTLINPAFSDGERSAGYAGVMEAGDVLVLDAVQGAAMLNGVDVTPYVAGVFPRLTPGEATLVYSGGAGSAHSASATVTFRDRWW